MKGNSFFVLFVMFVLITFVSACDKGEDSDKKKSVSITSISIGDNNVVYNNVETTISASVDNNEQIVSSVRFLIDGKEDKTLLASPFSYVKNLTDFATGKHTFDVIVRTNDGLEISKSSQFDFKVSEGDKYQAGIVIKVSSDGFSGTIASTYDLQGTFKYGAYNEDYDAFDMDDGLGNTNKFIERLDFNYAAIACLNLERDGYDDWYLPAFNEYALFEKHLSSLNIQDRSGYIYWSSTSDINDNKRALAYAFGVLYGNSTDKQQLLKVRPCRRFNPVN